MYLQTRIWPEDRPKFRFLWRNLEVDRDPDVYKFERIVFGDASAPFRLSQENVKIHEETFTLASKTVKKNRRTWIIRWIQLGTMTFQSNSTNVNFCGKKQG